MRTLRAICFFLVFSIDITVRATGLSALKEPLEEPANCLNSTGVCALATYQGTKYRFTIGPTEVTLGNETSISRLDWGRYVLLSGEIWVRSEDEVTVETEYGSVSVYRGEALISRTDKKVTVKSLLGQVMIHPKGGQSLEVERGFENSMLPVGKKGKGETGLPQLMDMRSTLKTLAALYQGEKKQFEKMASKVFDQWSERVEVASEFHSSLAMRTIASDSEATLRLQRQREKEEAERRRLNKLFREKTLGY